MRPVDEIPQDFFEPQNELGWRLPLLERWLEKWEGKKPLAGWTVLMVQHQLSNHAAQADGLVRLGAEPARIHWLDIPYTSHKAMREHVTKHLHIQNFTSCDDYRVLMSYAPYQHDRTVRLVLSLAKQAPERLLVLDDGAYVLEALSSLKPDRWPRHIAIVEQTTRGMIKLEASAALEATARQIPLVNVAGSVPKRTLEPPFIGMSVCACLDRLVRRRPSQRPRGRCLILGYGAIGEEVANFVTTSFGIERSNIYVHDTDRERLKTAVNGGFRIWDRANQGTLFDLVIGCSGRSSFKVGDYVYLENGALLASASSGAVELSRHEFVELADASPLDDIEIEKAGLDAADIHADLDFRLVDRQATFLNAGFPVNFDGRITTTPGRFIQVTPVIMLAAAVQAVEADRPYINELDGAFCDWVDRAFREELGKDAKYLIPPPERAW